MTLGEISVLAAEALEEASNRLANNDHTDAMAFALVSLAASVYLASILEAERR